MFLNLIRWFRGFVVFDIIGRFPERFINLSTRQGHFVLFSKPRKDNFTAALLLCDYRTIRPIARKSGVRLKVRERHGLPFLLGKYKARCGLLIGLLLFLIITVFMQSFVWTIEFSGLTTISQSTLKEALAEEGVFVGAFKPTLDLSAVQRKIMKNIDEVGWMSVNIIGTKAEVEVKEKELKPHILEANVPCNIKAGMDGLILSMNTKYGKAVVSSGSAVIKGSLLVSAVVENPSGDVSIVHADAKVMAQTQRTKSFVLERKGVFYKPTDEASRYRLRAFWLEFPITVTSVKQSYTSRFVTKSVFLNNTEMPISVTVEHCSRFSPNIYSLSQSQAQGIFAVEDYLYRLFSLSECESINAQRHYAETDSFYSMDVLYECEEDIAVYENLVVN